MSQKRFIEVRCDGIDCDLVQHLEMPEDEGETIPGLQIKHASFGSNRTGVLRHSTFWVGDLCEPCYTRMIEAVQAFAKRSQPSPTTDQVRG